MRNTLEGERGIIIYIRLLQGDEQEYWLISPVYDPQIMMGQIPQR